MACKPGSVFHLSAEATIPLGQPSPVASRDLPGLLRPERPAELPRRTAPIWSCSRWGLPCHSCYQERGALLPHHFTLTCKQAV